MIVLLACSTVLAPIPSEAEAPDPPTPARPTDCLARGEIERRYREIRAADDAQVDAALAATGLSRVQVVSSHGKDLPGGTRGATGETYTDEWERRRWRI